MSEIFINGISCISPQETFNNSDFPAEWTDYSGDFLSCREPVYKDHINPTLARRLSRYIKMGVTTALTALKDAGTEMPEAIITGTGLGSTEDNEKILLAMHENQERMINPTHFIQSTHNTISSQIAIMLKCHHYNNTYVHRGFSFESALLDAMLLLREGRSRTALVGGVDALTEGHYINYERISRWRRNRSGSLKMITDQGKGVIPGEGSAHFVLSTDKTETSYASLKALKLVYKPAEPAALTDAASNLLKDGGLLPQDISLLLYGHNGDPEGDRWYQDFHQSLFCGTPSAYYKHLCGEYDTAGAFALWMASMIMRRGRVPSGIMTKEGAAGDIRHLLIYTHHRGDQHVLCLLSRV